MRLRKPCEHGKYDGHPVEIGPFAYPDCHGGEFLPEDALIIERDIEGDWSYGVRRAMVEAAGNHREKYITLNAFLKAIAANQVGNL